MKQWKNRSELLNIFLQNVEKNSGEYYSNDMNEKAAKYIRKIKDEMWQKNMKEREKDLKLSKKE